MNNQHTADSVWRGRPNNIGWIHPIGFLTRVLPAVVGASVVVWLVHEVLSIQSNRYSTESIIVDALMGLMTLPIFIPCIFIMGEPLRRKLFWKCLECPALWQVNEKLMTDDMHQPWRTTRI